MPELTKKQIEEIESGDGIYYMPQERAFAPGISDMNGGWPNVIPAPHTDNGRLVKRKAGEDA